MKTITESREEFNSTMDPYVALVIKTEHKPFTDEFFKKNGLIVPSSRVYYVPPPWVGAEFSPHFIAVYGRDDRPDKWREETIPQIKPMEKYLLCDDYSSDGETLEIAIIRLMESGVNPDYIWCLTHANFEMKKGPVLDRSLAWHHYRLRQNGLTRIILEDLGFKYPGLDI